MTKFHTCILVLWLALIQPISVMGQLNLEPGEICGCKSCKLIEHLELNRQRNLECAGSTEGILLNNHLLRIAYVIPSNRSPQPNGIQNLKWMVSTMQNFFREQLDRNGFGEKTFQFELDSDGISPKVHIVSLEEPDNYYRADDDSNNVFTIYERVIEDSVAAGIGIFSPGEVWLVVYEGHRQLDNGQVLGGVALGAGFGSGSGGGVGLMSSERLSLFGLESLADIRPYDGLTFPEIGPYSLVQGISFPGFEGTTVSSIVSSSIGACCHEVGHGFGLPHDFRNDSNFFGNLMGNGCRGFRNYLLPSQFSGEETRLAYGSCLRLNSSRFFNNVQANDEIAPVINSMNITFDEQLGQLIVSFTTSDSSGLSCAILQRNGNAEAEISLTGSSENTEVVTPYFDLNTTNSFTLFVFDIYGNRASNHLEFVPDFSDNRAPEPFARVSPSRLELGESVVLNANFSTDSDDSDNEILFEWDVDGDGEFDTSPSLDGIMELPVYSSGTHLVQLKVTDPSGTSSVSSPIAIRVDDPNPLVEIHYFDPSVYNNDVEQLDISTGTYGYEIEDFENTNLASGLSVSLTGNGIDELLSELVQVNSYEDTWSGVGAINNSITNETPFNFAALPRRITFNFDVPKQSVGIGLSGFQSLSGPTPITDHRLYVNGVEQPGTLEELAGEFWVPGRLVRNVFLRVDASESEAIESIGFENINISGQSDWLQFDRLSMASYRGDLNRDNSVDLLDVTPFVDALTNGAYQFEADVNQDGAVDLLDVGPFVTVLSGG